MFDAAREQAKADAIPRYAEPTWDELREADFDEFITCESCNWYVACGKSDARTVVQGLSHYSNVGRNRYDRKAVENSVLRCGICAKRTELRACDDPICDDGYDERI